MERRFGDEAKRILQQERHIQGDVEEILGTVLGAFRELVHNKNKKPLEDFLREPMNEDVCNVLSELRDFSDGSEGTLFTVFRTMVERESQGNKGQ